MSSPMASLLSSVGDKNVNEKNEATTKQTELAESSFFWLRLVKVLSYVAVFFSLYHLATFLSSTQRIDSDLGIYRVESSNNVVNIVWDLILVLAFIAQHTGLSSNSVKEAWQSSPLFSRFERPVYLISTSLVLELVALAWRPITNHAIWSCDDLGIACHILFYANVIGWLLLVLLSFSVYRPYYADLFTASPTSSAQKSENECPIKLQHPTLVAILLILWSTPTLTIDRFLLATSFTLYLLCMNSVTQQDYEYFRSTITNSNPILFGNASKGDKQS